MAGHLDFVLFGHGYDLPQPVVNALPHFVFIGRPVFKLAQRLVQFVQLKGRYRQLPPRPVFEGVRKMALR